MHYITYIGAAMATTKPRITITITPRMHELLKVISGATGASMSATVSELLESAEPVLERMAATMNALHDLNKQRKASIVAALEDAQSQLEPVMNAVIGQFDLFVGRVEDAAGVGGAHGSGAPRAPLPLAKIPRPVITGDKPPSTPVKKQPAKSAKTKAQSASRRKTA